MTAPIPCGPCPSEASTVPVTKTVHDPSGEEKAPVKTNPTPVVVAPTTKTDYKPKIVKKASKVVEDDVPTKNVTIAKKDSSPKPDSTSPHHENEDPVLPEDKATLRAFPPQAVADVEIRKVSDDINIQLAQTGVNKNIGHDHANL